MHYLIQMKLAAHSRPNTPQEEAAFIETTARARQAFSSLRTKPRTSRGPADLFGLTTRAQIKLLNRETIDTPTGFASTVI